MMKTNTIEIQYTTFADREALTEADRLLLEKAEEASYSAYAPYSKFRVGAAVRLSNGEIVTGNNQENASYPQGLCAERVAVFAASAKYPQYQVETLAVSGNPNNPQMNDFISPCGACRQVLLESEQRFGNKIRVLFTKTTGEVLAVDGCGQLLPFAFEMNNIDK